MSLKLAAVLAWALIPSVLGLPSLLECAADSETRLKLGGKAIMAGPTTACPADCPVSIAVSNSAADGTMKVVVTTTSVMNFAVRVNDADGVLSSTHANISSQCSRQMHSVSATGVPAGAYTFDLAPANKAATADDVTITVGFAKAFAPGVVLARHPPLAPATLYRCVSNACAAAKIGVSMTECKQLCGGQADALV